MAMDWRYTSDIGWHSRYSQINFIHAVCVTMEEGKFSFLHGVTVPYSLSNQVRYRPVVTAITQLSHGGSWFTHGLLQLMGAAIEARLKPWSHPFM